MRADPRAPRPPALDPEPPAHRFDAIAQAGEAEPLGLQRPAHDVIRHLDVHDVGSRMDAHVDELALRRVLLRG